MSAEATGSVANVLAILSEANRSGPLCRGGTTSRDGERGPRPVHSCTRALCVGDFVEDCKNLHLVCIEHGRERFQVGALALVERNEAVLTETLIHLRLIGL